MTSTAGTPAPIWRIPPSVLATHAEALHVNAWPQTLHEAELADVVVAIGVLWLDSIGAVDRWSLTARRKRTVDAVHVALQEAVRRRRGTWETARPQEVK